MCHLISANSNSCRSNPFGGYPKKSNFVFGLLAAGSSLRIRMSVQEREMAEGFYKVYDNRQLAPNAVLLFAAISLRYRGTCHRSGWECNYNFIYDAYNRQMANGDVPDSISISISELFNFTPDTTMYNDYWEWQTLTRCICNLFVFRFLRILHINVHV